MGFKVYRQLKLEHSNAIQRHLGSHHVDSTEKLPSDRQVQVDFLEKALLNLDALADVSALDKNWDMKAEQTGDHIKAKIFTGLILVVVKQIEESYRLRQRVATYIPSSSFFSSMMKPMLNALPGPENSTLFEGLSRVIDQENLSMSERYDAVTKAITFLKCPILKSPFFSSPVDPDSYMVRTLNVAVELQKTISIHLMTSSHQQPHFVDVEFSLEEEKPVNSM